MGPEAENVSKLREAYRLWHETRGASLDHWLELMADDVVFRSLAGGAPGLDFTRDCQSRDQVSRYFAELGADWEMVHYTVDALIADGDRVAMLGSCAWVHRATGQTVETPKADFHRFRDGKIVEFFEFFDTARALAAASPVE
jgi:ketosteroid isomerase-like protein